MATDRVAIVTGAAGGLGRVVTRELAADGLRLGLVGMRLSRLEGLADELGLAPDSWFAQSADLRDPMAASAAVEAVIDRFGRADILVHLVGGWSGAAPVAELPAEQLAGMLDQHLWTTFNVAKALVPHLTARGWGRIVAISSPVAAAPPARAAAYAVGKGAQEILLTTLAREVAGTGVTVNVLLVRTIDVGHERDRERTPRNAAWTTPEEIVGAIRYLCSDEGGTLNGTRIPLFGSG